VWPLPCTIRVVLWIARISLALASHRHCEAHCFLVVFVSFFSTGPSPFSRPRRDIYVGGKVAPKLFSPLPLPHLLTTLLSDLRYCPFFLPLVCSALRCARPLCDVLSPAIGHDFRFVLLSKAGNHFLSSPSWCFRLLPRVFFGLQDCLHSDLRAVFRPHLFSFRRLSRGSRPFPLKL